MAALYIWTTEEVEIRFVFNLIGIQFSDERLTKYFYKPHIKLFISLEVLLNIQIHLYLIEPHFKYARKLIKTYKYRN